MIRGCHGRQARPYGGSLKILVEEADDVAYPAAHQFGPCHRDVHHMGAAPVVAHQVDRLLEALQLGDQPAAVFLYRGRGPWGHGSAETRWGQTHDRSAIEKRSQSVPDSSSLGVAVDEAYRHARLLRISFEYPRAPTATTGPVNKTPTDGRGICNAAG